MERPIFKAIIVGAGPAGLTAVYELSKQHAPVLFSRATPNMLAESLETVNYKGFRFDIGGHRFFSKSREVEEFWTRLRAKTCWIVRGRRAFTTEDSSIPIL